MAILAQWQSTGSHNQLSWVQFLLLCFSLYDVRIINLYVFELQHSPNVVHSPGGSPDIVTPVALHVRQAVGSSTLTHVKQEESHTTR